MSFKYIGCLAHNLTITRTGYFQGERIRAKID